MCFYKVGLTLKKHMRWISRVLVKLFLSLISFCQVDGVDLRDASHEEAVEAIRRAGNPVSFLVQSIIHRPRVSLLNHVKTYCL